MKRTKKSRLEEARTIIDRNRIDVPFADGDRCDMNGVLEADFAGFVRRINPEFRSDPRHLHVDDGDGSWRSFSWNKAITNPPIEQSWKAAMRSVLDDLRQEYKESQDEHVCHECGVMCRGRSLDRATVDETPPCVDLIEGYRTQFGWPKFHNPGRGDGYRFEDINEEANWIAWASSRWTLRILCKSCNSSKGAGDKPKTSKADRVRRHAAKNAPKNKQLDMFA